MKSSIAITGVPFDNYSSFMRGAASGPSGIIDALYSSSANLSSEFLVDISGNSNWEFIGNIDFVRKNEADEENTCWSFFF